MQTWKAATWNCSARVQIKRKTISCSQLLQNTWIIKQTVVLLWKNWRKYWSVSYLFSCTWDHFWFCSARLFNVFIFTFPTLFTFFIFLSKLKQKFKKLTFYTPGLSTAQSATVSTVWAPLSNQLITEKSVRRNQRKILSQIRATFLEIILFNLFN